MRQQLTNLIQHRDYIAGIAMNEEVKEGGNAPMMLGRVWLVLTNPYGFNSDRLWPILDQCNVGERLAIWHAINFHESVWEDVIAMTLLPEELDKLTEVMNNALVSYIDAAQRQAKIEEGGRADGNA